MGAAQLDHTVSTITRQGIATATYRAYTSGVCHYLTFCTLFNKQSFPLSELVICHFAASLVQDNMSYNTIRLYLSAICYHQMLDGNEDIPTCTAPPPLSALQMPSFTGHNCSPRKTPNHSHTPVVYSPTLVRPS